MWVWVLSVTVLGSNPEHHIIPKFETKQECEKALVEKIKELQSNNKESVGRCYYSKVESKGWWQ